MIAAVLDAMYELLIREDLPNVRRLYQPGRPAGPFVQHLPAVMITPGDPAEERGITAEDAVEVTYRVDVWVITRELLETPEQPNNIGSTTEIASRIADLLEANDDLGGAVDYTQSLSVYISPGMARISGVFIEYRRRKE